MRGGASASTGWEAARSADHFAHFFFPREVWEELKAQGRIVPHPVFPDKHGPAARMIENEDDVRDVIELMRLNYDRITTRAGAPARVA